MKKIFAKLQSKGLKRGEMIELLKRIGLIRQVINKGKLYLTRIYLWRSERFGLYLHIFHKPDIADVHLHNHPWAWCWTMPLWGGYDEIIQPGTWRPYTKQRFALQPRRFPGSQFHRVAKLYRPWVLTLFAHGPVVRDWCFYVDGAHVPWWKYLVEQGINTQEEIDEIRKRKHP